MTTYPSYTIRTACFYSVLLMIAVLIAGRAAFAQRAALVIDADSGAVLYSQNPRLPSYPASLAKLMTVYLIFEAIETNRIELSDRLPVSAAAAKMPAVRLGLKQGQTITLKDIVLAMTVWSANDAAVVAAERLAGSEPAFGKMMTARARALGMSDTVFHNASGLPHPGQVTSARDMAILARALLTDYPRHYSIISTRVFKYRGKTRSTSDNFIRSVDKSHRLKTGFTCFAGYNLVVLAESNGRRLIGVVLGAKNARQRNAGMANMLELAAARINTTRYDLSIDSFSDTTNQAMGWQPNRKAIAENCLVGPSPAGPAFEKASGWGVVVGVKKHEKEALSRARKAVRQNPKTLRKGRTLAVPFLRGVLLNRAMVTDLKKEDAVATCHNMRSQGKSCLVVTPKVVRMYVDRGRKALNHVKTASNRYTGNRITQ